MTLQEILAGESKNLEFKVRRPKDSIKYMKSVVAFANGEGGRIIFGVDDKTHQVEGIPEEQVFRRSMRLRKQYQTAANRRLFRMSIFRRLRAKRSSLPIFRKEDSGHILSNPLGKKRESMSVWPVQADRRMSI